MRRHASSNWPSAAQAIAKYDQCDGSDTLAPVDRTAVIPEVSMCTASEALPVSARCHLHHHSQRLPEQGALFVGQSRKFIGFRVCRRVILAEDIGPRCMEQRIHRRGGVTYLARILERLHGVCERRLGIAEQPEGPRPIGQLATPTSWAKGVICERCSRGF